MQSNEFINQTILNNINLMNIPFVDLKAQYQSIKNEMDSAIANVINETAFIGGKYVKEFEQNFATLYGVKHCISVANGTDSLYILMKMMGIQKGDEVIAMGIIGRITKIGDGYIGLEVADGKILHMQRQAVTTLLPKGTFNDVTK